MRAESPPGIRTWICWSLTGAGGGPSVDEPLPARLGGVGALRVHVGDRGPLLHDLVELEQAALLALPLLQPVAEQLLALLARLRVGAVGAAVDPCAAVRLQREDRVRGRAEQVAVVADQDHRLLRLRDPPLELELGRHVEEVVGLVEQQDGGVGGEQHLEHEPLALAARQLRGVARADVVEPGAHDPAAGRVPLALQLVAAQLGPVPDRLAQAHPRAGGIGARGQLPLGDEHPLARRRAAARARPRAAARARCGRCRARPRRPGACTRTCRCRRRRRRPSAARRGCGTGWTCRRRWRPRGRRAPGRELERDLREQQVAAGMGVGDVRDDDVGHRRSVYGYAQRILRRTTVPSAPRADLHEVGDLVRDPHAPAADLVARPARAGRRAGRRSGRGRAPRSAGRRRRARRARCRGRRRGGRCSWRAR